MVGSKNKLAGNCFATGGLYNKQPEYSDFEAGKRFAGDLRILLEVFFSLCFFDRSRKADSSVQGVWQ